MTHAPQIRIPATYMRGGTSKGVFFRLNDLPEAARVPGKARDALLQRVIGSPDPYGKHTDGMGGATSSTSKCVIISKSSVPGHDVDYLYGQVAIEESFVDWSGNCGNLSTAVGPFAIAAGLIDADRIPQDGLCTVRIWQANIGKTIIAHVPVTNGQVQETGDFELDGVTFPAAEIQLEFLDPSDDGDAGGSMFPTGNLVDDLEVPGVGTFKATMITAGIPTIFLDAADLGYTGSELQDAINKDATALANFEKIRAHGALRMGLIKHLDEAKTRQHTPKVAFVAPAADYVASSGKQVAAGDIDLRARAMSMGKRGRHRHGGIDSRHAGESRGRRRRTRGGALRPSLRHVARGRAGEARRRTVDRDESHHEPQRARADGRLGAGASGFVLNTPL
jgi:2-methylaconitate isomerase